MGGRGLIKIWMSTVYFREEGSFKLGGCGQTGWGVKKFALFCKRHKWMTPIIAHLYQNSANDFYMLKNELQMFSK